MNFLDLTLPAPAENLALDEALLDEAESDAQTPQVLRIWEPPAPMVVAGRSTRIADEVRLDRCRDLHIPVFRRASGGATIVTGPGCLMYAVVIGYEEHPELRPIDRAHDFVLSKLARALSRLATGVEMQGASDLTLRGRKFSGNSLRIKRNHFLYHGTILYDFDLPLISQLLRMPPRRPDYRADRAHEDFVLNLQASRAELVKALCAAFDATKETENCPSDRLGELVRARYSRDEWNLRL